MKEFELDETTSFDYGPDGDASRQEAPIDTLSETAAKEIGKTAVAAGEYMTEEGLYISARAKNDIDKDTPRTPTERRTAVIELILLNGINFRLEGSDIGHRARRALRYKRREGTEDFQYLRKHELLKLEKDPNRPNAFSALELLPEAIGPNINAGRLVLMEDRFLPEGFEYDPVKKKPKEKENTRMRDLWFNFYRAGTGKSIMYGKRMSSRSFAALDDLTKAALVVGQYSKMRDFPDEQVSEWIIRMMNKGMPEEARYQEEQIKEIFEQAENEGYISKDAEGKWILEDKSNEILPSLKNSGRVKQTFLKR